MEDKEKLRKEFDEHMQSVYTTENSATVRRSFEWFYSKLSAKQLEIDSLTSNNVELALESQDRQNIIDSLQKESDNKSEALAWADDELVRLRNSAEVATNMYGNAMNKIFRLEGLLSKCDDLLSMLEDTAHGEEGRRITEMRGEIVDSYTKQSALPQEQEKPAEEVYTKEAVKTLITWLADNVTFGDNSHYQHIVYGKQKMFTWQLLEEFKKSEEYATIRLRHGNDK